MSVPRDMGRVYAITVTVLLAIAVIVWVALQPPHRINGVPG